jgi:hypothetical protein
MVVRERFGISLIGLVRHLVGLQGLEMLRKRAELFPEICSLLSGNLCRLRSERSSQLICTNTRCAAERKAHGWQRGDLATNLVKGLSALVQRDDVVLVRVVGLEDFLSDDSKSFRSVSPAI